MTNNGYPRIDLGGPPPPEPRILPGCSVLPPMDPPPAATPPHASTGRKPKGSADRRAHPNRFAILNAFVDFTAGTLTRGELLVWLALYRDTRDGVAKSSQRDIARRTGLSLRGVQKCLDKLQSKRLVKVTRRGRFRGGASSYIVFPLDPTANAHPQ